MKISKIPRKYEKIARKLLSLGTPEKYLLRCCKLCGRNGHGTSADFISWFAKDWDKCAPTKVKFLFNTLSLNKFFWYYGKYTNEYAEKHKQELEDSFTI